MSLSFSLGSTTKSFLKLLTKLFKSFCKLFTGGFDVPSVGVAAANAFPSSDKAEL